MRKALIFGCGEIGTGTYYILKSLYDVVAWVDNNESLWGKKKENTKIISPKEMVTLMSENDVDLFVAVMKSDEIVQQLYSYQLNNFYVWKEGFFFFNASTGIQYKYSTQMKVEINESEKNVLFVMSDILGGIREYRLAKVLKKVGYKIYLAYMMPIVGKLDDSFSDVYEKMIHILSLDDLMNLANNNNFEFIHSSSEPEWATGFLINSNKRVIHECHDLGSANVNMSPAQLATEYIANVDSDGVIYPSEKVRDDAVVKFGIPRSKTLVIENLISESLIPTMRKKKISKGDGELHLVYEGAISSSDKRDKRFFEDIWLKIVREGVHLHFYTSHGEQYCKYLESLHENIHYEGNLSSMELAVEMSKYDLGLLIFNVNEGNKLYLENASPNKLYEYVNAGIPVATYGIETYKSFVKKHYVGDEVDFEKDLVTQFKKISQIHIPIDFIKDNKLTIESNEKEIINFLNKRR